MNINAISEAVKSLAQSLQVATIFPATLLVLVNAYILLPATRWLKYDLTAPTTTTLIVAFALLLSYIFYAFNFPILRLLEGQKLKWLPPHDWLSAAQKKYHTWLQSELDWREKRLSAIENRLYTPERYTVDPEWRQLSTDVMRRKREFDRDFPANVESVLPTALGNTIAAFEDYPRTRYGMESIALWPRLVPVLKEKNYLEFVTQEKTVFDFMLNTGLVVGVLGLEATALVLESGHSGLGLIFLAGTMAGTAFFYEGMIVAARHWGATVRVAFDLYRRDLHQHLGLRGAGEESFADEYEQWGAVSQFFLTRPVDPEFPHFLSQMEYEARDAPAGKGENHD